MKWTRYIAKGEDYIQIVRWGKNHWSTFAYLETRVVDYRGVVNNVHMRCNARLHREFANTSSRKIHIGSKYPTRLNDGEIEKHDDWSCLEDMVAAGLLKAEVSTKDNEEIFGHAIARVEITELGTQISGMLRAHKAAGETFSTFCLNENDLEILTKSLVRI